MNNRMPCNLVAKCLKQKEDEKRDINIIHN